MNLELFSSLFLCLLFNGRGGSSSNSTTVGERLLSTLLTEMDGLEEAKVSIRSH
jgi:SpoVK/Ycf46/Vps4 family AAA+-type ATPase